MNLKNRIVHMLQLRRTSRASNAFNMAHGLALCLGMAVVVLGSVPSVAAAAGPLLATVCYALVLFFALEYGLRLAFASELGAAREMLSPGEARLRWATSLPGIVDLLAWLPLLAALLLVSDAAHARLFGAFWILKFGRHAPRLGLLGRVLRHAREALLAVFVGFLGILLIAAILAYVIEGPEQPDTFGSVPAALWWAITTLTTTGYGDVIPHTVLGRLLAGMVMVCGILVFALWAGILATEFSLEMRRHDFLRTWDLVAKVPYFEKLEAITIAEVVHLLKPIEFAAGTVVVRRGAPGDCMYFIVEGEVEIQVKPEPVILAAGSFFGEIALITGGPRTATAVARRQSVLLALDIAHFRELAATRPDLTAAIDAEAKRRVAQANAAEG